MFCTGVTNRALFLKIEQLCPSLLWVVFPGSRWPLELQYDIHKNYSHTNSSNKNNSFPRMLKPQPKSCCPVIPMITTNSLPSLCNPCPPLLLTPSQSPLKHTLDGAMEQLKQIIELDITQFYLRRNAFKFLKYQIVFRVFKQCIGHPQ